MAKRKKSILIRLFIWVAVTLLCAPVVLYFAVSVLDAGFSAETNKERPFLSKLLNGIVTVYEDHASYFRSLPTDEEMIRNFKKHRVDFERLVKIFREDLSVPLKAGLLDPTPDVKRLMAKINVSYVTHDRQTWVSPDPYDQREQYRVRFHRPRTMAVIRKHSGVVLGYAFDSVASLRAGGPILKSYYYVPVVPRITAGMLETPFTVLSDDDMRVFQSLDNRLSDLKPYSVLFRRIEPHWFLQLRVWE